MDFPSNAARRDYNLKNEIMEELAGGGVPVEVSSSDITDATATGIAVLTAANVAAARTAIGAGTSNLAIGTTASTAAAGNHVHTAAVVTVAAGTDGLAAGNVQAALQALATRIAALETP